MVLRVRVVVADVVDECVGVGVSVCVTLELTDDVPVEVPDWVLLTVELSLRVCVGDELTEMVPLCVLLILMDGVPVEVDDTLTLSVTLTVGVSVRVIEVVGD